MDVGYCAHLSLIPNARKWPNIAAQYCDCLASRTKDAKPYTANGSRTVANTNVSTRDGLLGILSCAHYHSQRDIKHGEIPEVTQ